MLKKRKIAVVTGSRSEFGILYHVINELKMCEELECQLIVTGSHLALSQGETIKEITDNNFEIDVKIPMLLDGDTDDCIANSMGLGIIKISGEFRRLSPDLLLVLGDRYEIFASCIAAMAMKIPIAHIAGGETDHTTNIDGNIRNAITKMAHLHFVGTQLYAKRVLAMGEEAWRVFNVGLPSLDNITQNLMNKITLENELGLRLNKFIFLVTYLPVGVDSQDSGYSYELKELFNALDEFMENADIIFTLSNADAGGRIINQLIREYSNERSFIHVYQSLGKKRYLSLMNICNVVIGNSSSAIIEAPSFKKATVNIGNRQSGRVLQDSVINVEGKKEEIVKAINKALYDKKFREVLINTKNMYGEGNSSKEIVKILKEIEINKAFLEKRLIY